MRFYKPSRMSYNFYKGTVFDKRMYYTVGYYAYYGKKLDPEPWRCRRTDGKKWRCTKEAYPDSKYCERHMHRGRNRSRKPVESSSTPNSISTTKAPSPPATPSLLTSVLNPAAPRGFDPLSAPPAVSGNSGSQGLCLDGPTSTHGYLNRCVFCLSKHLNLITSLLICVITQVA